MGTSLKIGLLSITVAAAAMMAGGCSLDGSPRPRLGCYATSTPGTRFIDANGLGKHSYHGSPFEGDGIAYTCRGGHIDVTHARIGADNTRYLYNKTKKGLMEGDTNFTYSLNVDRSTYYVTLTYPDNWKSLPKADKEKIADEVSLELSQYFTYTMVTWHEILTWFGFKTMAVLPEFPSAFSWEDNYSNLLGIRLGAQAVQDKEHDYDEAMTIILKRELENLGVQSHTFARNAAEKMRGKWWDGEIMVDMKERNMDIGLADGYATPTLVPGVCGDVQPQSLPVPTLTVLAKYGFTMNLEIKPGEWESGQILKIVYPDGKAKRIHPSTDIPIVMEYLKKDGIRRGYNVMPP
ncbi:MAG TPA: DUF4056 domain-containing protein, partial [Methylococcales bacterium]